MGTAKQLIPTFVDAQPLYWDRSYAKNMRPIRGYPDWWRIIDTEAFIDGPVTQGGQYVDDLYIWKAEILRDDNFDLTDTFGTSNLRERLTSSSSIVDGQTVYKYKYLFSEPDFSYTHTDVVDSISLEFDQSGRRLIAFESTGNVYFYWFDSQAGATVTSNFGEGYNPVIVTDSYDRTSTSITSERLLFYVDNATKQIVYRRQLDRFQTVYTLPAAPSDVVELIKVSKNIYGGLTVLYCYDDGAGGLLTGSFTATDGVDRLNVGTDGRLVEEASLYAGAGTILSFGLKDAVISTNPVDDSSILAYGLGSILNFDVRSSEVMLQEQTSTDTLAAGTGSVLNFNIKDVRILTEEQKDNTAMVPTASSGAILNFNIKDVLIQLSNELESATVSASIGTLLNFNLGP